MSTGTTRRRPRVSAAALACVLALPACSDELPPDVAPESPLAPPVEPTPMPIRRLNRTEYNGTVRDLLGPYGVTLRAADSFPPDLKARGFDNNAALLQVPAGQAEAFLVAAEVLAQAATNNLAKLAPCDAAKEDDRVCARRFVVDLGRRAYRRPLEDAEVSALLDTYALGKQAKDYRTGIEYTLQHLLQSPHFLYRVEFGAGPAPTPGARAPLSGFEVAARLSYFFWKTMPDDRLHLLAGSGQLETAEQVGAEAQRMLKDPKARAMVADFHLQWLAVDRIDQAEKNAQAFPAYAAARPFLKAETAEFVAHVVFDGGGDLRTLLTAPYSFVNDKTAPLYGLTGVTGATLIRTPLDARVRAGVLTQPGLLAVHAKPVETSPVVRGHFIRERFLCQSVPDPPPGVNTNLPPPDPMNPNQDRFAEQLKNPTCAACHRRMNPIGAAFSQFDAVGQYRPLDSKMQPIAARGNALDSDVEGEVDGAAALAERLAGSRQVAACVARQWFRYAMGRSEAAEDEPALAALGEEFQRGGAKIPELLYRLSQSDGFLQR